MRGRLNMPRFSTVQRVFRRSKIIRRLVLIDLKTTRARLYQAIRANDMALMTTVGVYLNTWGSIEGILNTFIAHYHPFAGSLMSQPSLPTNLADKIKYLSTVSKDGRLPNDIKSKIASWVVGLGTERNFRHMIVHGVSIRLNRRGEPIWRFQKLTLKGTVPTLENETYSMTQIHERQRAASELLRNIAETLNPILFPPWPQTSSTNRP